MATLKLKMTLSQSEKRTMFLVDQRLLTKIWEEKRVSITIEFHQIDLRGQNGWEAHVITNEGVALFMTAKGEVRRWRQLNAAVKDLKEILPDLREFKVITI